MSKHHSSHHTSSNAKKVNSEDRKPYLDKICANPNIPPVSGFKDLNSGNVFPSLQHTGLKSAFEPETTTVTNPHGRITHQYRLESYKTMKEIYRDDYDLKGREDIFKVSHKQYLDKILVDMENKKSESVARRTKHWTAGKSQYGFSDSFNPNATSASSHVSYSAAYEDDPDFVPTDEGHVINNVKNGDSIDRALEDAESRASTSSSSIFRERIGKPVNRVALFRTLLKATEMPTPQPASPPSSPTRRYGAMVMDLKKNLPANTVALINNAGGPHANKKAKHKH